MKTSVGSAVSFLLLASTAAASFYDLTAIDVDGKNVSLSPYKGTVSMVVNVATYWGTTKANYECMQSLQKEYLGKPVNILLFPCNQFLFQEPDTNAKIKAFAGGYLNFTRGDVKLFSKSGCNSPCKSSGSDQCNLSSKKCCTANNPVYDYLKAQIPGSLSWNFNKFIVGKDGIPIAPRFGDNAYADKLETAINKLL